MHHDDEGAEMPPVERSQGTPRPQPPRPDELPDGVPEPARPADDEQPTGTRDSTGRYVAGTDETREAARRAALIRHRRERDDAQVRRYLGRVELPDDHPVRPYREDGGTFHVEHCGELAKTVGGGVCGPGPSSVVATAALQMAASRWLFDLATVGKDPKLMMLASKLGNDSRQNLLSAHELCAKEGAARIDDDDHDPLMVTEGK